MSVFPGNPYGVVDPFRHKHPAQQIVYDSRVFFIRLHKRTGKTYRAFLSQGLFFRKIIPVSHAGQRQEGGAAKTVLFQERDHFLGRLFSVCYNVLDVSAQSRLHRSLVFLIYPDQIRYHAEDTRLPALLLHDFFDTASITVIAFCHVSQGFQS